VGWRKVAGDMHGFEKDGPGCRTLLKIIAGNISLFSALFCVGEFILGSATRGILLAALAVGSGIALAILMFRESESGVD
jgi:hypothetical protein